MISIAIVGIKGRMGQEILDLVQEDSDLHVVTGVDAQSTASGKEIKIVKSVDELEAGKIDVMVDFSSPDVFEDVLRWAGTNATALVSGTTGLAEKDFQGIDLATKKAPVIWAPNMSVGVAWLSKVLPLLKELDGFDFQIEESHHSQKKDRPSGTAVHLQKILKSKIDPGASEPISIRGGGIFGIHTVLAMGPEETITLKHTALNRRVFARGALRAAKWLVGKSAGRYTMEDVIAD